MAESGICLHYLLLSWLNSQASSIPVVVAPDAPEYGHSRLQAFILPVKRELFSPSAFNENLGQMLQRQSLWGNTVLHF